MKVSSRNNPPNIERGILKTGSPDSTLVDGRANEYANQNTAKNTAPSPCVIKTIFDT